MYQEALAVISKQAVDKVKKQVIEEIKREKQSELMVDRNNRRSSRIGRNPNLALGFSEADESTKIGLLTLVNLCRQFREEHKDELYKYEAVEEDQNSMSQYKNSETSRNVSKRTTNKREEKEIRKKEEICMYHNKSLSKILFILYLLLFFGPCFNTSQ